MEQPILGIHHVTAIASGPHALCGHALSHLTAMLAQTGIGTQCPKCSTTLRCVHGEPHLSGEEARRQLSAVTYDFCNIGRLLGRHLNINKWSLASRKETETKVTTTRKDLKGK